MKLSIIIPVYKTPSELFAACMESVSSWTADDLEIIVVIDSPGHAIEADVYAWTKKDARIRVLRNDENRGPSYSRNRGIDSARGDYVMMVDADDRILPSVCQKALECCRENKLAYCAVARVYPWQKDGVDCHETHRLHTGSFDQDNGEGLIEVLSRLDMSSSGVWYDRSFLNRHRLRYPEDLRQNEDFVFTTGVLATGVSVGIWDEYGYQITCHADSLSQNRKASTFFTHQLAAAQRIMALLESNQLPLPALCFYANHGYNQVFAPWHRVAFDTNEDRRRSIGNLGLAAKKYNARYDLCLRFPARCLIWAVSMFPSVMFFRPPLMNYAFRLVRKMGLLLGMKGAVGAC